MKENTKSPNTDMKKKKEENNEMSDFLQTFQRIMLFSGAMPE